MRRAQRLCSGLAWPKACLSRPEPPLRRSMAWEGGSQTLRTEMSRLKDKSFQAKASTRESYSTSWSE